MVRMNLCADDHRRMAAEYRRLGGSAKTEQERQDFMRMAQEHLLLVEPDPLLLPPEA